MQTVDYHYAKAVMKAECRSSKLKSKSL